ncbi:MAG: exosortase B [Thiomicrorhabdus sp.]|nr:exosortase B [Thiomicrorhabdus sp.]
MNTVEITKLSIIVPFLAAFVLLYWSIYAQLFNEVWVTDEQAHGPIVFAIVIFLFWSNWKSLDPNDSTSSSKVMGYLCMLMSAFLYIIGKSQSLLEFAVLSQFFLLFGFFLAFFGYSSVKRLWFPILFLLFLVPIPGAVLAMITLPLKIAVSYVSENILHFFDYPIARTGVILQIGYYKLLVADACAGVHTIISLEAMGLLYLYLIKSTSALRNITLAILIVPIAFIANVIRVIVLVLITFHYGDEAGQGFLHDFAGFVLFFVALVFIIFTDTFLRWLSKKMKKSEGQNENV